MSDVRIILGSDSDVKYLNESRLYTIFRTTGVSWTASVYSAHRHREELLDYLEGAEENPYCYITIAGGSAHLPGVIASIMPDIPVIGVAEWVSTMRLLCPQCCICPRAYQLLSQESGRPE